MSSKKIRMIKASGVGREDREEMNCVKTTKVEETKGRREEEPFGRFMLEDGAMAVKECRGRKIVGRMGDEGGELHYGWKEGRDDGSEKCLLED